MPERDGLTKGCRETQEKDNQSRITTYLDQSPVVIERSLTSPFDPPIRRILTRHMLGCFTLILQNHLPDGNDEWIQFILVIFIRHVGIVLEENGRLDPRNQVRRAQEVAAECQSSLVPYHKVEQFARQVEDITDLLKDEAIGCAGRWVLGVGGKLEKTSYTSASDSGTSVYPVRHLPLVLHSRSSARQLLVQSCHFIAQSHIHRRTRRRLGAGLFNPVLHSRGSFTHTC